MVYISVKVRTIQQNSIRFIHKSMGIGDEMIKQIGDKMGRYQWEQGMQMRYDTMPPWWWDNSKRDQAYQNYLEGKAYD